MRQRSLQLCRYILPGVVPGPMPGANLPGAKALAGSFAMSGFAGYSAPGKTPGKRPFAKAFCILPGLLPLAKCNISCSVDQQNMYINLYKYDVNSLHVRREAN